jgi:elongation factor G
MVRRLTERASTMNYKSEDIRNVCLVGPSNAGKTQLVEALLFAGGSIGQCGSVDRGDTVSDFTARKKAFTEAVANAAPILMEPVVDVTVTVPSRCAGGVTGDLSSMRGMVSGTEALNDDRIVSGQVPLKEMQGYHSRLKSLTGGDGSFTMDFSLYAELPADVLDSMVAKSAH